MKAFVALFVLAFVVAGCLALTEEQKAKAREHADVCAAEHKLAEEDVKKLQAGDFSNESENAKCFANCVLERAGIMKNGELQEQVAIDKLSTTVEKEKVEEVVKLCKDLKGDNACETSFKVYQCYKQNKAY